MSASPTPRPTPRALRVTLPPTSGPCRYRPQVDESVELCMMLGQPAAVAGPMLRAGWRHFGMVWFRPSTACCGRCLSLRVPVRQFAPSKSQRAAVARAQRAGLEVTIGEPIATLEKAEMYRDHKQRFDGAPEDYSLATFHRSFCIVPEITREFQYRISGKLLGVGYVTTADGIASSQYFFFAPEASSWRLGTVSLITEIAWSREQGFEHLLLGYFVADNRHLSYKADFRPNEVLQANGEWTPFRHADGSWVQDPTTLVIGPSPCQLDVVDLPLDAIE